MLHCPKCGRTYETDTQKFCTHDGGRLTPDEQVSGNQAPTAYDLNQTVLNDPFDPEATVLRPDLNKTVTSHPTSEIRPRGTGPAQPSEQYRMEPPAQPPVRESQPTVAFNQPPPMPPPLSQPQPPPPPQQQPQYYQSSPAAPTINAPMPPPQHQQPPYAPAPQQQQFQHGAQLAPRKAGKSSRAPLIIGLVVLVLLGGAAAWYFLVYKKADGGANSNTNVANANTNANVSANANGNANMSANANTNVTPPPPANSTQFVNSSASLDGKLAENYTDFSFYYPNSWEKDPKMGVAGASNFVQVERRLPPDFTQENFAVSWYKSSGTFETDSEGLFKQAVALAKEKFSKTLPEFEVVSEGETTVNGIKGYEFRFQGEAKGTEKGDVTFWGRVVFLPPGTEGKTNGLQLLMLTTSLAPELASADDVGVRGELPIILNSFRMGSK
jgi:hypothetical protein